MSESTAYGLGRIAARLAVTGLIGAWVAGCSSDATRFEGFSNPFATSSNDGPPTPNANVASAAPNAHYAAAAHPSPVSVAALPAPSAPSSTGAIRPTTTQPITGFSGNWSAAGGSPIIVADGENIDVISRRYGVPQSALLEANGFTSASQVRPGARVIIPIYNANKAASAEPRTRVAEDSEPRTPKTAKEKAKERAEKEADADGDAADHKKAHAKAKLAERDSAKEKHEAKSEKSDKAEKSAKSEKSDKSEKTAKADKADKAHKADADGAETAPAKKQAEAKLDPAAGKKKVATDQTPTGSVHAEETPAPAPAATADAAGVSPEFRWPARGRIIEGFKAGGNDGINIAVPEGTSVKAAESGVVAYAGSELKGYGNLVLIRHPNGFVTAYANNGELEVKRGEQVKRGQTIAKSGQSGNVTSPQLHFELRKGSTPVDPTSYLAGL
jgi:murein DD-endopeptidase MepM/ murein hydrolase activator NlpD